MYINYFRNTLDNRCPHTRKSIYNVEPGINHLCGLQVRPWSYATLQQSPAQTIGEYVLKRSHRYKQAHVFELMEAAALDELFLARLEGKAAAELLQHLPDIKAKQSHDST